MFIQFSQFRDRRTGYRNLRCDLLQCLFVFFMKNPVGRHPRIAALLLELLFMRKMLVYILVQKLDGFIHRCPPFPLTAGIQQFVHRPDQLPVLLVYRCVSRFQRLRNFISVHLYPPPISTYGDNMIS